MDTETRARVVAPAPLRVEWRCPHCLRLLGWVSDDGALRFPNGDEARLPATRRCPRCKRVARYPRD